MKNIFHSRLEAYFPIALVYMGYLLIPVGAIVTFTVSYLVGPGLMVAGLFLITAHYGIVIDCGQNRYKEYWGALALKSGSWKLLPKVSYIFTNSKKYSQVFGSRGTSSKIQFTIYRGFLKTIGEEQIEIIQSKNREKVIAKAKEMASQLQVKVQDGTAS